MTHIMRIDEMFGAPLYAGNGQGGKITYTTDFNTADFSPEVYIPKLFRTKAAYKQYEGFLQIAADELGFDLTIQPAPWMGRGNWVEIKGEHYSPSGSIDGKFHIMWRTKNDVAISTYLRNEMSVDKTNYPLVHKLADEYEKRYENVNESRVNEGKSERFIFSLEQYRNMSDKLKFDSVEYLKRICAAYGGHYNFFDHGIDGLCITDNENNVALAEVTEMQVVQNALVFSTESNPEYPADEVDAGELGSIAMEVYNHE